MFNSHFRYLIESSSKERLKKKKNHILLVCDS
ncbi:rCG34207 [Rattus norvegicus]|uniref:RCG34207 n=1 Tax=Rattus norvegicus TaxID=10116 RepID=A6HEB2_RAT|nr:rCG34207 [Rattus norvegicus]